MQQKAQDDPYPERWDPQWISKRKQLESKRLGHGRARDLSNPLPMPIHYRLLKWFLQAIDLYERGYRNFLDIRVNNVNHLSIYWPFQLSGLRILQLSDLHIDLDGALMDPLCEIIKDLKCDLIVFTGDFWQGSRHNLDQTLASMDRLFACLPDHPYGKFGVLGNHDHLHLAAALEARGLPVLVNEARVIETKKGSFSLAGVDDAFYFRLHDLQAATNQWHRE